MGALQPVRCQVEDLQNAPFCNVTLFSPFPGPVSHLECQALHEACYSFSRAAVGDGDGEPPAPLGKTVDIVSSL